jgi:hypothetical protein
VRHENVRSGPKRKRKGKSAASDVIEVTECDGGDEGAEEGRRGWNESL